MPGETAEYNSVDAALWFIEAGRQYFAATQDLSLVREIFPALAQIIDAYARGTRYNIHVDSGDGLIYAGEAGVQLTWMDSKIGDWVVTPRVGKPVEVNALWLNALSTHGEICGGAGNFFRTVCGTCRAGSRGFQRFWNPGGKLLL